MKQPKFEQIAYTTHQPDAVKDVINNVMGLEGEDAEWSTDIVVTEGKVLTSIGPDGIPEYEEGQTRALLNFNYANGMELEILTYLNGPNWLSTKGKPSQCHIPQPSHVGSHVTKEELDAWLDHMDKMGVHVAQHVKTVSHTNPFLVENGRRYEYVIFLTEQLFGFDFKLIRRIEAGEE